MAISRVQAVSVVNTTGTQTLITISATGSGNLIVVTLIGGPGGQDISSITDNATGGSNTYIATPNGYINDGSHVADTWYAKNINSGATTVTVNINTSTGSGNCVIGITEYSGASSTSPLEISSNASGSGAPVGPALTTLNTGSVLIATCYATSTGTSGVSSPWVSTTGSLKFTADYLPGATGTYTANFTPVTSQAYVSSGASFVPPSSTNPALVTSTLLVF
jgi:hypothetical protein